MSQHLEADGQTILMPLNDNTVENKEIVDTTRSEPVSPVDSSHSASHTLPVDGCQQTEYIKEEGCDQEEREGFEGHVVEGDELAMPSPVTVTDDESVVSQASWVESEGETVVTVKFRTDTNETVTSTFNIHSKIIQVKERVANIFKVSLQDICLSYDGTECDDLVPLSGLGVEPLGTIELGIRPTDPTRVLAPLEFNRYIPIVDVITVRVSHDNGGFKDVVVEIENQCTAKRWLGGYRHRITKIEYHHAEMQTLPRKRLMVANFPLQRSTNTQTPVFPLKEIAVSTQPSKATQMLPSDLWLPNLSDRIVSAVSERYQPRKAMNMPQLVLIITMVRRYYRQFSQRRSKRHQRLQDEKRLEKENRLKKQKEKRATKMDRKVTVGTGATVPLSRSHFYMLYLLIGKWWRREMTKIASTKCDESRRAALMDLLRREVDLISVVEQQRIEAKKQASLKQDLRFLETTARPIIFRDSKDSITSIDTLETQRAREYQDIVINSFLKFNVSKEQRLDALKSMKNWMKRYEGRYEQANEIFALFERECQLLALGVTNSQMTGLRSRVVELLFHFLHKHIVHPNWKNQIKLTTSNKNDSLYLCLHCRKLKPACEYNVHVNMTSFNTCKSCEWIKNIGLERIDLSPFARLLAQVRQYEMDKCSYTSVCYVLQVVGMYYLTRYIWCCKSILSDVRDMNDLRMVRFRKHEDWAPWNCILLTTEESAAHLDIDNVYEFYSEPFLERIRWRHMRAKNHFMPLLVNDNLMRENKFWFNKTE